MAVKEGAVMTSKTPKYVLLCIAALCLLLAGCRPADPAPLESEPESSAQTESVEESESLSELRARRLEAVEGLRGEYADLIEADTLNTMIGEEKSSTTHEELFKRDQEEYLDLVRLRFNMVLPFRSQGSLIGPKAPEDLEAARNYIREEFSAFVTDETRESFEDVLKMMENESAAQSPTPYADYPQQNFDWARNNLWTRYGCTIETNTNFFDHP